MSGIPRMTQLQKILPREVRNKAVGHASLSRTLVSALRVPYLRKPTVLGQQLWLITLKCAFSFSYCLKQTRAHSSRPGTTGASSALLESGVLPHGVVMNSATPESGQVPHSHPTTPLRCMHSGRRAVSFLLPRR